MTEINDIVADEAFKMTDILVRAFKKLSCNPECHCCEKKIQVGMTAKLAYNEESGNDEMLCRSCTIADLNTKRAAAEKQLRDARGSGFTRRHPL